MAARRRGLTPDERELWSRIARSAKALHPPGKPAESHREETTLPISEKAATTPAAFPRFRVGQSSLPSNPASVRVQSPAEWLADAAPRMDAKAYKRMTQGKMRPEARLDLHGMTLAQAQPELTRFVLSCHANGLRLVLVITGKGRGDHGPLPTRPGALRHQVPHWLHRTPLAPVVQQVTAAHYRHGGEGAYYVYLRR